MIMAAVLGRQLCPEILEGLSAAQTARDCVVTVGSRRLVRTKVGYWSKGP